MAYIVTEPCIKCKFTDCVAVCPADCFHEGENMLVINPDTCIDCGACETECPVNAIYQDGDVPADQQKFVEINERLAQKWPILTIQRTALPTAEEFRNVKSKLGLLEE